MTSHKSGYVVVLIEYIFDGQYYSLPSRGGVPIRIFFELDQANQFCNEQNIKAFQETDISKFIIDNNWTFIFDDVEKMAAKHALNLDEPWNIALPSDLNKLKEFANDCKLRFYKVVETNLTPHG